jgi:hypothetical protein
MPTTYFIALKLGGALVRSLGWYWSLPQLARQAADARTLDHIEETFRTPMRNLSFEQAQQVYDWARARHA